MKKTLALTAFLCGASAAFAEYTYIDAWTNNTTLETSGTIIFSSTDKPNLDPPDANAILEGDATSNPNDDLWSFRDRDNANGTTPGVWAAGAGADETELERLVTTFELPGTGVYNIAGFFWSQGQWDAGFQLGASGSQVDFTAGGTSSTNLNDNSGIVSAAVSTFDSGSIDLYLADLGTWDAGTNGTTVSVYIHDPVNGSTAQDRIWYDGVGFVVVPEPSTYAALLGVVALLAAHSRRRYMPRASK